MKFLCWLFGHKPKEYPPLKYWGPNGPVESSNVPVFCERCGCSELDIILDK